jgi:N-acetylneuraminic acid mutarotase
MSSHSAAVTGLLVALTFLPACDGGHESGHESGPSSDLNLKDMHWKSLAPVPQPRFYVGVGAAKEKVFVIGGFRPADAKLVNAFDTRTSTWATIKPLPSDYSLPNVATVNDRLFVLGGLENPNALEYDFAKDDWIPRKPMPVERGRAGAAVGVWGNTVLLAGGVVKGQSANNLNTGVRMDSFYAYDVSTDSWTTLDPMPWENGYAMGAVVGNLFWVFGGSTNFARTDEALVYDVPNKVWMKANMKVPVSLSSGAAAVLGGRIILTGGIATGSGTINQDTLVLDPVTTAWSTIATLPTPRFAMGAAVVGNRFYVPTGLGEVPTAAMYDAMPAMEVLGL